MDSSSHNEGGRVGIIVGGMSHVSGEFVGHSVGSGPISGPIGVFVSLGAYVGAIVGDLEIGRAHV